MTVIPDAPWWANVIVVLAIALVPTFFAVHSKREATAAAGKADAAKKVAEESHEQTTERLGRVLHNVENSHTVGLRDDLDQKVGGLDDKLESVIARLEGAIGLVSAVVETTKENTQAVMAMQGQLTAVQSDVIMVRRSQRGNASQIAAIDRRVETALEQAQEMLDVHHPGTVLRDRHEFDEG